jgi:hypothetical protein
MGHAQINIELLICTLFIINFPHLSSRTYRILIPIHHGTFFSATFLFSNVIIENILSQHSYITITEIKMLRWLIIIIALALMVSSCENPCTINHQVRVKFDWRFTDIRIEPTADWNGYTPTVLENEMMSSISGAFNDPDQLLIVDTLPDYIIRVDSVDAYSFDETQTMTKPCSTRGWLGNILLGPDENTFHLHGINLAVKINLINAQTHAGKKLYPSAQDSQTLTQPPSSDSINCNDYVVEGSPNAENVINSSSFHFHDLVKCQIHVWQNQ